MEADGVRVLRERVEQLIREVADLRNAGGGMLSSKDFADWHVEPEHETHYLRAFEKREWSTKIDGEKRAGDMFLIKAYRPLNVTPFSYDLTIGKEAYSLRTASKESLFKDTPYELQPGETIIILTEEYLALPNSYSATVWPRFGMVSEGIFQSMVKIDPTWRGHLAIAMTNVSPATYPVRRGKGFGTLILYQLKRPTDLVLCSVVEAKRVAVVHEKVNGDIDEREIAEQLKVADLSDLCSFAGGTLTIAGMRRSVHFDKLRSLHSDKSWCKAVDTAEQKMSEQSLIGTAAYDLTSLDRLLEGPCDGTRLKEEDLNRAYSQTEFQALLDGAAVEYGKPLHLLRGMPQHIMNSVEDRIVPRVRAEVGRSVFPELITLTLRVLSLLSLLGVMVALAAKYFDLKATWLGIIALLVILVGFFALLRGLRRTFKEDGDAVSWIENDAAPPQAPNQRPNWRVPWLYDVLDKFLSRRKKP